MPTKHYCCQLDSCRSKKRHFFLAIIGVVLTLFGVLCGIFWERLFHCFLSKEMVIRENSEIYDNWKTPPFDLTLDIYFFNWTNPEDFLNKSTKPILEELGPYRFIERPTKVDIVWHSENASVTYRKRSDFYFDADASSGSLDDNVLSLNPVALSAGARAKQWIPASRKVVNSGLFIYNQQLTVLKTVDELLFTGYSDDLLSIARIMPIFGKQLEVPFDKFGWFYTRNGSADLTGTFNVHTGADDIRKRGQMYSWNHGTRTKNFGSYCGLVNGSAGEFQPPNLKKYDSVSLFTPDMCRTIPLDYTESVEIEGVLGYKFAGGLRSVDNGSVYPENECFCNGACVPSGVMNVSSCRFGSPVFMSYPHFYNADPYYLNQVEGLQPDKEAHEFYMIMEPNTGIALEVAARFQVNMLVEPIRDISMYEKVPRTFFPLIWFEQKVRIPKEMADNLKVIPYVLLFGHILAGVCFFVGLALICWYLIENYCRRKNSLSIKPQPSPIKPSNGPELVKEYPEKSPLIGRITNPTIVSNSNVSNNIATITTSSTTT